MITLSQGHYKSISIHPRWPARMVLVDEVALEQLVEVQSKLPDNLGLILTRAYEEGTSSLGFLRNFSRVLGISLFKSIFPNRKNEIRDIFGSNGHDVDGTHLDVSISIDGKRKRPLPFSVFTPLFIQRKTIRSYRVELDMVKQALIKNGFKIHSNETESLQIHCDLQG